MSERHSTVRRGNADARPKPVRNDATAKINEFNTLLEESCETEKTSRICTWLDENKESVREVCPGLLEHIGKCKNCLIGPYVLLRMLLDSSTCQSAIDDSLVDKIVTSWHSQVICTMRKKGSKPKQTQRPQELRSISPHEDKGNCGNDSHNNNLLRNELPKENKQVVAKSRHKREASDKAALKLYGSQKAQKIYLNFENNSLKKRQATPPRTQNTAKLKQKETVLPDINSYKENTIPVTIDFGPRRLPSCTDEFMAKLEEEQEGTKKADVQKSNTINNNIPKLMLNDIAIEENPISSNVNASVTTDRGAAGLSDSSFYPQLFFEKINSTNFQRLKTGRRGKRLSLCHITHVNNPIPYPGLIVLSESSYMNYNHTQFMINMLRQLDHSHGESSSIKHCSSKGSSGSNSVNLKLCPVDTNGGPSEHNYSVSHFSSIFPSLILMSKNIGRAIIGANKRVLNQLVLKEEDTNPSNKRKQNKIESAKPFDANIQLTGLSNLMKRNASQLWYMLMSFNETRSLGDEDQSTYELIYNIITYILENINLRNIPIKIKKILVRAVFNLVLIVLQDSTVALASMMSKLSKSVIRSITIYCISPPFCIELPRELKPLNVYLLMFEQLEFITKRLLVDVIDDKHDSDGLDDSLLKVAAQNNAIVISTLNNVIMENGNASMEAPLRGARVYKDIMEDDVYFLSFFAEKLISLKKKTVKNLEYFQDKDTRERYLAYLQHLIDKLSDSGTPFLSSKLMYSRCKLLKNDHNSKFTYFTPPAQDENNDRRPVIFLLLSHLLLFVGGQFLECIIGEQCVKSHSLLYSVKSYFGKKEVLPSQVTDMIKKCKYQRPEISLPLRQIEFIINMLFSLNFLSWLRSYSRILFIDYQLPDEYFQEIPKIFHQITNITMLNLRRRKMVSQLDPFMLTDMRIRVCKHLSIVATLISMKHSYYHDEYRRLLIYHGNSASFSSDKTKSAQQNLLMPNAIIDPLSSCSTYRIMNGISLRGMPCLYDDIMFSTTSNTNSTSVSESLSPKICMSLSMLSFLISPTIGYLSHYLYNEKLSSSKKATNSFLNVLEKFHILIGIGDIITTPTSYYTLLLQYEKGISPLVMNNVSNDIAYIDLYFVKACDFVQKVLLQNAGVFRMNIYNIDPEAVQNIATKENTCAREYKILDSISQYGLQSALPFQYDILSSIKDYSSNVNLPTRKAGMKYSIPYSHSILLHSYFHIISAFLRRRCQHTRIRLYMSGLVRFIGRILISTMGNIVEVDGTRSFYSGTSKPSNILSYENSHKSGKQLSKQRIGFSSSSNLSTRASQVKRDEDFEGTKSICLKDITELSLQDTIESQSMESNGSKLIALNMDLIPIKKSDDKCLSEIEEISSERESGCSEYSSTDSDGWGEVAKRLNIDMGNESYSSSSSDEHKTSNTNHTYSNETDLSDCSLTSEFDNSIRFSCPIAINQSNARNPIEIIQEQEAEQQLNEPTVQKIEYRRIYYIPDMEMYLQFIEFLFVSIMEPPFYTIDMLYTGGISKQKTSAFNITAMVNLDKEDDSAHLYGQGSQELALDNSYTQPKKVKVLKGFEACTSILDILNACIKFICSKAESEYQENVSSPLCTKFFSILLLLLQKTCENIGTGAVRLFKMMNATSQNEYLFEHLENRKELGPHFQKIAQGAYGVIYSGNMHIYGDPMDDPENYLICNRTHICIKLINSNNYKYIENVYNEITILDILNRNHEPIHTELLDYGLSNNMYYLIIKKYTMSLKKFRTEIANKLMENLGFKELIGALKGAEAEEVLDVSTLPPYLIGLNKNYNRIYADRDNRISPTHSARIPSYLIPDIVSLIFFYPILLMLYQQTIDCIIKIHNTNIIHYDIKLDNVLVELNTEHVDKITAFNPLDPFTYFQNEFNTDSKLPISLRICDFGESLLNTANFYKYNQQITDPTPPDVNALYTHMTNATSRSSDYYSNANTNNQKLLDLIIKSTYKIVNRGTEYIKSPEMLTNVDSTSTKIHYNFQSENPSAQIPQKNKIFSNDRRRMQEPATASDVWGCGCLLYELLANQYLMYDKDWARFFVRTLQSSSIQTQITEENGASTNDLGSYGINTVLLVPEKLLLIGNKRDIIILISHILTYIAPYRPTLLFVQNKITGLLAAAQQSPTTSFTSLRSKASQLVNIIEEKIALFKKDGIKLLTLEKLMNMKKADMTERQKEVFQLLPVANIFSFFGEDVWNFTTNMSTAANYPMDDIVINNHNPAFSVEIGDKMEDEMFQDDDTTSRNTIKRLIQDITFESLYQPERSVPIDRAYTFITPFLLTTTDTSIATTIINRATFPTFITICGATDEPDPTFDFEKFKAGLIACEDNIFLISEHEEVMKVMRELNKLFNQIRRKTFTNDAAILSAQTCGTCASDICMYAAMLFLLTSGVPLHTAYNTIQNQCGSTPLYMSRLQMALLQTVSLKAQVVLNTPEMNGYRCVCGNISLVVSGLSDVSLPEKYLSLQLGSLTLREKAVRTFKRHNIDSEHIVWLKYEKDFFSSIETFEELEQKKVRIVSCPICKLPMLIVTSYDREDEERYILTCLPFKPLL